MSASRILIVDDDASLLRLLSLRLQKEGYAVVEASGGEEALGLLEAALPDLVITDMRMGGMDGAALFEAVHRRHPSLPVIILTAHGTIPDAVDATRRGVFGYLTKPFEARALMTEVERALSLAGNATPSGDEEWREGIVTCSPMMERVLAEARLLATNDASVLLAGESGTGKELLARAIHEASARRDGPFVAVNCGAIPEALMESELFGHVKGAFTGAARDHRGLIPSASGGTLFLDEIGDMPLPLQVKLLRVLQEREVRPVGATQPVRIDVRVISATHRDLKAACAEGRFREDLYYRLNVVSLALPPLASRREDIPLLASHFLATLSARYGRTLGGFAPEAMELLVASPWRGNVRELQNVVEKCVALGTSPLV
ncbi:MAG TPA: sigma-54 dependent transcriptional regulator, partial [Usitatibacteraceae bacterium]|nr:sigma-54 dependent transcriptional regulator [Usitatibacteraceae bacterium]